MYKLTRFQFSKFNWSGFGRIYIFKSGRSRTWE